MTTAKAVNFTNEQTAELVAAYQASPVKETVEAFATKFGKSTKSIVAKLSREKVYVKAVYTPKTGKAVVLKETLVNQVAEALGVPAERVGSLESATKATLELLVAALTKEVEAEAE